MMAMAILLGAAFLRILYLVKFCPLDLAPDEAHYWDWSRHLDWSYYSKGPLVAWLIRLSCELFGPWSMTLTGSEMVAVRLPAVLCGSLVLLALYVLTTLVYGKEKWALYVVALGTTVPLLAAGSTLMTIDAPFICCWSWALVFVYLGLFRASKVSWGLAAVCVFLGFLAKHTMVLWVPALACFLWFTPGFRARIWRPGFWLLVAGGVLGALPILVWNINHDWVTLKHTGGHAGLDRERTLYPWGPLNYVAVQAAVLLGFWFFLWVMAVWRHRPGREIRPERLFLWWMSAPIFFFFALFSLKNGGGEPNWPMAAYISGSILSLEALAGLLQTSRPLLRKCAWAGLAACTLAGILMTLLVHDTHLARPLMMQLAGPPTEKNPMPLRRFDPTCRLRGWRTLAKEVDRLRVELTNAGNEPEVAGAHWSLPGEIGFYCQGQPQVHCVALTADERRQYELWRPHPMKDADNFQGKTFILVGMTDALVRPAFDQVEPTHWIVHRENGQPVASWAVTVGRGFRGFPASNPP
jgi:4-amino-4-deoxy-L-arabinose transferase-like glycosyltransferase